MMLWILYERKINKTILSRTQKESEGEGGRGRENLSLSMKRTISSAQKDRVKLERKEMITP